MQVLFYFYSFIFVLSAGIVLHDSYCLSMLTDRLPQIHILLSLVGLSGLMTIQARGLERFALLVCVLFFCLQYFYVQELVGQDYKNFIYLGITRAANSYILFVSSKRMIEEKT